MFGSLKLLNTWGSQVHSWALAIVCNTKTINIYIADLLTDAD